MAALQGYLIAKRIGFFKFQHFIYQVKDNFVLIIFHYLKDSLAFPQKFVIKNLFFFISLLHCSVVLIQLEVDV